MAMVDGHPSKRLKVAHTVREEEQAFAAATAPLQYGNYHNYYSVRQTQASTADGDPIDSRLRLLEMFGDGGLNSVFLNKNVLDVGCNEGRVTCAISQHLGARHVKGVDIDPFLIRKAKEYKRKLYSRQKPGCDTQVRFFPLSSLDKHGLRPLLDAGDKVSILPRLGSFPENTDFVAQDWLQTPLGDDEEGIYDVVLALSLTKWIHLNSFDSGLKSFFDKCLRTLRPGGYFIVEPQPWPSYVTAVKKKCRALASNLDRLEMRPENGFGGWLVKSGWEEVFIAGGNEEGKGFDAREIRVYLKPLVVTAVKKS